MEGMNYSELVQTVLERHTENHLFEDTDKELIFNFQRNHYILVHVGWGNKERVYGCVVHVNVKDGKIWIQRDLIEEGIANQLVEFGVTKTDIVLGFRSPYVQQFTGFSSV
ncbi:XisI protein [Nostoc sp.]|uniref:XisI protein n=1 Tax=Nostoc sp. TaxID=1180 RepID=UPI002FFC2396